MRRIVMVLGYEGTRYSGFQTQPGGNTIQDFIETALFKLTGETIKVVASGRTDAGVHARAQVIHFDTDSRIPIERWCLALNSYLPRDIVFHDAFEASLAFHARRSAKRKTYRYTINNNRYHDVFRHQLQFHHPTRLNIPAMEEALPYLIGKHDFTTFCSTHSTKESHVRTIYDVRLEREPDSVPTRSGQGQGILHFYITGNGFLYNMVRIITGTLLQIGEGKRKSEDMAALLEAKDRTVAGATAMAHGLMLWEVDYGEALSTC